MITSNYFVVVIIVCEGWSIRWVLRSFIQKFPATNFRPVPSATLSVPPLSVLLLRRPQKSYNELIGDKLDENPDEFKKQAPILFAKIQSMKTPEESPKTPPTEPPESPSEEDMPIATGQKEMQAELRTQIEYLTK